MSNTKEALLTCYISLVPEYYRTDTSKCRQIKPGANWWPDATWGQWECFFFIIWMMKKANNWNAFGFFDDFISRRGYKDYKLILHTLGGFCDLFYLDSSFFFFFLFTVPLLFSAEYLSLSIHIHPQSVCDTAYKTSQPKHFTSGLCCASLVCGLIEVSRPKPRWQRLCLSHLSTGRLAEDQHRARLRGRHQDHVF